tara:strand:- start:2123 stop:2713 length:591 start_codon:yes stop_codon:yes gene_type:complete
MTDDVGSNELTQAHRQSGIMLVLILSLLALVIFAQLNIYIGSSAFIVVLLPLPFCIIAIKAYFDRQSWALLSVIAMWIIVIALCFVMMILEFMAASTGSTGLWGYAQGFLLLFLCWSMNQRLRVLRHPLFKAWYEGRTGELSQDIALLPDEVLASCPHCHSLLAVQPVNLSADERCPKCNLLLVLPESLALYGEEE